MNARSKTADPKPTPAEIVQARMQVEASGGAPSLDELLKMLRESCAKLDVAAASFGPLSGLTYERLGTAVIVSQVAEELGEIFVRLADWKSAHTEVQS